VPFVFAEYVAGAPPTDSTNSVCSQQLTAVTAGEPLERGGPGHEEPSTSSHQEPSNSYSFDEEDCDEDDTNTSM